MALKPIDRLTVVYAALAALALQLRWPADRPLPAGLLAFNVVLVAVALSAPWLRRQGTLGRFLGDFYALILTVGTYTAIGILNRAAGVAHDATVQRWEQALFGGQPSLEWIRAWPHPAVAWPLHLGYLSYYFILAGAPLGLLLARRRDAARDAVTLIMTAFYACYAVFLYFPVAGPRYLFPHADNAATHTAVARFTQDLLDSAAAWGTAFPSSHVAASLVAALAAWRGWRPLGMALLPAAVLLALGTVYGQFHYAVDALAGVAVAGVIWAARRWLTPAGNTWGPGGEAAQRREAPGAAHPDSLRVGIA
jgi:membrane-associated phospholipid phosphatase